MLYTSQTGLLRPLCLFDSMASSPSWSLRSSLMATTTWSAVSTSPRKSWLPSTRPCLTTTSTWRGLSSNPTWWLLDTPAHTSTAARRSQWPLSPPCAAPCPLQSPVSQMCKNTLMSVTLMCVFLLWRNYLPVWRPERGRSLRQPELHEPVPPA